MRASVTRYLMLSEMYSAEHEADHLLGLVDEICYQSGEDVEDYLWKAQNEAGMVISNLEELRCAVEEMVAVDLFMAPDDLRAVLRLSSP
ncbi:MAG: hypothetical protein ISF22_01480 [Methanomassiliicoccus sp.]|nr:hypothetical protein [Methanomassiliicoccus sp.]